MEQGGLQRPIWRPLGGPTSIYFSHSFASTSLDGFDKVECLRERHRCLSTSHAGVG